MNLSHCLEPLTPEHRKRLDAWARTLPGTIHKPWSTESLPERRVRLANEQMLRTRRIPKLR